MLHPGYPVVEGLYWLTADWAVTLPFEMNRRLEDNSLVLWRPGFTIWISVYGNEDGLTCRKRYERVRNDANPARFDERLVERSSAILFSYRLKEHHPAPALYTFAFASTGHVQAALYFDIESDAEMAERVAMSLTTSLT